VRSVWLALLVALTCLPPSARAQDDFADEDARAIEDELPPPPEDDAIADDELGQPPAPAAEPAAAEPALAREPGAVEDYSRREIVREEERPSSTPGEKIFDWSKHQGETEVAHPFAEKGLIRIDKDRVYHYRVEEVDSNRAADFHAGPFNPTELANPNDDGPYATYADNYNGGAPAIFVNYEWQFAHSPLGKMGFRAGGGLFFSQGNGHFVHLNDLKPLEVFSFFAFPINAGLVYRFQFWHRQLVVPYAEGGGTLWAFGETRDDGKRPKFGGSLGAYAAAGAAFNLTYFNALSRIALDREYGIHAVYLLAEFRRTQGLSPHYDFSANFINGGLLMEF
jgi:hypothetical protein